MKSVDGGASRSLLPPRLSVAKEALQSWYDGEPELRMLPHICQRDELALDIGADRGVYAWHLRRMVREVVAFERQPDRAQFLRQAFGPSIRVEQVVLSDRAGAVTLRVPPDPAQGRDTTGPGRERREETAEIIVPRRRLDEYAFDRVAVIRIDVAGHELAVLRGAEALLARDRPTLLVKAEERHRQGAVESVAAHLAGLGYQGFFLRGRRVRSLGELLSKAEPGAEASSQDVRNFIFAARSDTIRRLEDMTSRAAL